MALRVWLDIPTYDWTNGNSQCLCWWFGFASRWRQLGSKPFCSCERFETEHHGTKTITSQGPKSRLSLAPPGAEEMMQQVKLVSLPTSRTNQAWGSTINGDTLPKRNEINRLETRPSWKRHLVQVPPGTYIKAITHTHEACNLLYRYILEQLEWSWTALSPNFSIVESPFLRWSTFRFWWWF